MGRDIYEGEPEGLVMDSDPRDLDDLIRLRRDTSGELVQRIIFNEFTVRDDPDYGDPAIIIFPEVPPENDTVSLIPPKMTQFILETVRTAP